MVYALDFLSSDLAQNVGNTNKPVIIYFHYGFDGWGLSWWAESSRTDFANVIGGYKVIAIFFGHSHASAIIDWNGYDTYGTSSAQSVPNPKGCWVVHIQPDGTFKLYDRNLNTNTWGMSDSKTITFSKLVSQPSPADDARGIETGTPLSWAPGYSNSSYNVYFGTSFTDVNEGTGGTFKGNQTALTYNPGTLSTDTIYYWRIDAVVNGDPGSPYKGPVWSFDTYTTQMLKGPYLIYPKDEF